MVISSRNYDHAAKGDSSYFVWTNQGKESITLDIKDPVDLALLKRIIGKSDVFLQNLAPGAMARLGLDAETLRAEFPALITCDISGYGEDPAVSHLKAYDFLIQSESGLVAVLGRARCSGSDRRFRLRYRCRYDSTRRHFRGIDITPKNRRGFGIEGFTI